MHPLGCPRRGPGHSQIHLKNGAWKEEEWAGAGFQENGVNPSGTTKEKSPLAPQGQDADACLKL